MPAEAAKDLLENAIVLSPATVTIICTFIGGIFSTVVGVLWAKNQKLHTERAADIKTAEDKLRERYADVLTEKDGNIATARVKTDKWEGLYLKEVTEHRATFLSKIETVTELKEAIEEFGVAIYELGESSDAINAKVLEALGGLDGFG